MLRGVHVAVHVVLTAVSGSVQQSYLCVEPPDEDLLAGHTLLRDDLQQRYGVAIGPLEHLANDRQQVPHAFRFAATQRSQQRGPLGSCRRRSGAQVINVAAIRHVPLNFNGDTFGRRGERYKSDNLTI